MVIFAEWKHCACTGFWGGFVCMMDTVMKYA